MGKTAKTKTARNAKRRAKEEAGSESAKVKEKASVKAVARAAAKLAAPPAASNPQRVKRIRPDPPPKAEEAGEDAPEAGDAAAAKKRKPRWARAPAAEECSEEGDGEEEDEEEDDDDGDAAEKDGAEADGDDDEEVSASLLNLRALLTPAGFGESAATEAAAKAAAAAAEAAERGLPPQQAQAPDEQGPDWTKRYVYVDQSSEPTPLEAISPSLHPAIERGLRRAGFETLFPIQAAVIPLLSRAAESSCDQDSPYSCDVCVAAPTGQGKTLAYALPIVQALLQRGTPKVRALALLPTRDLALQVFRVFEMLRQGLGPGVVQVRAQCLVGQRPFAEEQRALLEHPPDIVVCTPGRLADHCLGRGGRLDLSALRWFVVDEADRLLTQTYHRWLDVLDRAAAAPAAGGAAHCGPRLQKLLLSATMTWNPQKLAMLKLRRPLYFFSSKGGQHATPAGLKQHYLRCKPGAKPMAVLHLLRLLLHGEPEEGAAKGAPEARTGRAVVFCASVDTAHRLARLLQLAGTAPDGVGQEGREEKEEKATEEGGEDGETPRPAPAPLGEPGIIAEFSSNLEQKDRSALMKRFRRGQVRVLVCSDVAARGIDIPEVDAVINYSAPSHLQTYIHRVGRTARAGRKGSTFTFVRRTDMGRFEAMLRESADCWDRIRRYSLPAEAREAKQRWYAKALQRLQRCLQLEESGKIVSGRPLTEEGLKAAFAVAANAAKAQVEIDEHSLEAKRGVKREVANPERARDPAPEEAEANGAEEEEDGDAEAAPAPETKAARRAPPAPAEAEGGSMLDFVRALQRARDASAR